MAQHTVIPVLYRDSSNWKSCAEYHLLGTLDGQQLTRLRAALHLGHQFIPAQLGEDHISEMTKTPDDGPWHELVLDELEIFDGPRHGNRLHVRLDVETFVALVEEHAQAGWRPQDYPVEPDED